MNNLGLTRLRTIARSDPIDRIGLAPINGAHGKQWCAVRARTQRVVRLSEPTGDFLLLHLAEQAINPPSSQFPSLILPAFRGPFVSE